MMHAAIMGGVTARKNRQSALAESKARAAKLAFPSERIAARSKPRTIFEPRPEATPEDIRGLYGRTPVRYGGARTDSCLDYQTPAEPAKRKLVRRETVIASWKYLKEERERSLGARDREAEEADAPRRPGKKVSRSHSDREGAALHKYSSQRKSVIYKFDPERKVLRKEYRLLDGDDVQSAHSSEGDSRDLKDLSDLELAAEDAYACQRSSSFDKIKCLFKRVFTNNKSIA